MMKLRINPNLVNTHFKGALHNDVRYQIYFGGSSSSKSFSLFSFVPIWCLEGRSILIIRSNDAHITRSVWSETIKAISRLKLTKYFNINKSEIFVESIDLKGNRG